MASTIGVSKAGVGNLASACTGSPAFPTDSRACSNAVWPI